MSSRDPGFNAALQDLSRMAVEIALFNARSRQQESQFQQQLSLQEKQFDEEKRSSALNRIIAFSRFAKPGTTIGEHPFLQTSIQDAFPEISPEELADINTVTLTPETIDTLLLPVYKEGIKNLSPEMQARVTNARLLGTPASGAELDFSREKAEMLSASLKSLTNDPQFWQDVGARQMGMDPIHLNIDGRQIDFSTTDQARLAVSIAQHTDMMSMRRLEISQQGRIDVSGELMKQMEGLGGALSRPQAMEIIDIIANTDLGSPEDVQSLNEYRARLGETKPQAAAAFDLFTGTLQNAAEVELAFLRDNPVGEQMINYKILTGALEETVGKEQSAQITIDFLKRQSSLFGGALPRVAGRGPLGDRLKFGLPPTGEQPTKDEVEAFRLEASGDIENVLSGRMTLFNLLQKYPDPDARKVVIESLNYRRSIRK